jgi:hypothetical protein
MINETKSFFFKRFLEDTLGYFSVYEFLKLKFKKLKDDSVSFKSSQDFWESFLFETKLSTGQIVKLKDFYLSDFIPRLPGKLWTKESKAEQISGYREVIGTSLDRKVNILSLEGKRKIIESGYGSVRLMPNQTGIYCNLLSAVSVENWFADAGIPIVVSKSVYDEFVRTSKIGAPWIEELEGILHINQPVPLIHDIPKAIGAKLNEETMDLLTNSINLPKCFIYVPSPLNIKLRTNNTHPVVTAWTTFRTTEPNDPLRYTYSSFNPNKKGGIEHSIEFINNYVQDFNGTEILTDFDGKIRRLNSKVDLSQKSDLINSPVYNEVLLTINDWISK